MKPFDTGPATPTRLLVTLAAAGLLAAACGGAGQAGSSSGSAAKPAAGGATVVETHHGPLGTYLTDGSGRTLYTFAADKNGMSTCYGSCASFWPPLQAKGKVKAAGAAQSAALGTTARKDGAKQVTYDGHPLYRYSSDQAPGDMKGQGKNVNGGLWWVLSPSGSTITKAPSGGGSGSSSPGYGSGYG